ncbi:spore germination protein GerPB [Tepidibacillus sp. HK-1]|uniref:spore germination protein GerPB n=1 Tax=Tepidibacillus sp. HK-1 TaxID=1883407 RepID=UPI0008539F37|nr:spore germination protein GerPB [Tepidibacillus sp. HK-1]GBF10173.1 putative spore germination protein GerPB [Tepidibacillus sp. HK-1]
MNLHVNQTIIIHNIRINSIGNSSVFQIGSAGIIKPLSQLYNTGGFTEPVPELRPPQAPLSQFPHPTY